MSNINFRVIDWDQLTSTEHAGESVSDNLSSHRSVSKNGVKLLIVDGDFLK